MIRRRVSARRTDRFPSSYFLGKRLSLHDIDLQMQPI